MGRVTVMQKAQKQILFEDVDTSSIELAIKKRKPVKVNYVADENDKETGSGWRIIHPVAYGLSKSGNPVIRAYQPFGDTKTKVPHWKLFRVDRFETWNPINKQTNIPQPPLEEYNPNGDKSMSTVYLNADYAGAKQRYEKGGLARYNQQRHEQNVEKNPYYDLQRNIEKSKQMPVPNYVAKNVADWQKNRVSPMKKWINGASAEEMSRTTDFGDSNYIQTDEPIRKGNVEDTTQEQPIANNMQTQKDKQAYKNIAMNGPVNKGDEELKQNNTEETEENNQDNENNLQ